MSDNFNSTINNKSSDLDGDIDLKIFIRLFKRNWKLISVIIFFGTSFGLISSYRKDPIYRGNFQIVIDNKNQNNFFANSGLNDNFKNIIEKDSNNKTQEEILKSPYVLKPVFNFVKNEYGNRGENIEKLNFTDWRKFKLNIELKKNTNVLNVDFKDKDKQLIIETLNLISLNYQQYSKDNKQKELKKTLYYLKEEQKILFENAQNSLKKFNQFSIENGLSDIDGFAGLTRSDDFNTSKIENDLINTGGYSSSRYSGLNPEVRPLRFSSQFSLLENYESKYLNLSSKLKPNAKVLKDLELKIDNLKESLKRPNEILIKFRTLKRLAQRNEALLSNIEDSISVSLIQIKKQPDPWLTISNPFVDEYRVSPNRKNDLLKSLIISGFIGFLVSYLKENLSKKIFEFNTFKEKLNFNYIDSLNYGNEYVNTNYIKKISRNELNNKLGLISLSDNFFNPEENYIPDLKLFNTDKNLLEIKDFKSDLIQNCNSIILLVEPGKITFKNLELINKYLYEYSSKIKGWIFVG